MQEDCAECEDCAEYESFTIIFIDCLLVYAHKYYLKLSIDNSAYKIVNKKIIDYLDDNLFEFDESYSYK